MEIPKNWTFKSKDVADGFDQHVREQLPWYDLTTGIIAHVARHYIPSGGMVYDIGASTGNIGRAISQTLIDRKAKFIAIDDSEYMKDKYNGPNELVIADAVTYDYKPFDFATCFLVLMFIPVDKRIELVKNLKEKMKVGGALVIFEKCSPVGGYVGQIMSKLSLLGKVASGVDPKEIVEKELSLSGVQRPLELNEIAGAQEIFRFGDFAGWIVTK